MILDSLRLLDGIKGETYDYLTCSPAQIYSFHAALMISMPGCSLFLLAC